MKHPDKSICISIVSHGQADLINTLLSSLFSHCRKRDISLVLTSNIPETGSLIPDNAPFPVTIIENESPKGYGANHNQAFFKACSADFFCILNPDIIFTSDPFPSLITLLQDQSIGLVAPALYSSDHQLQDSAREFPTPGRMLRRRIFKAKNTPHLSTKNLLYPDWVAGMFMLIPASVFRRVNGFDEKYFMYCEDTDLCFRLKQHNLKTAYTHSATAVHNPQRKSHKNLQHLRWHVSSLWRFMRHM